MRQRVTKPGRISSPDQRPLFVSSRPVATAQETHDQATLTARLRGTNQHDEYRRLLKRNNVPLQRASMGQ